MKSICKNVPVNIVTLLMLFITVKLKPYVILYNGGRVK